MKANAGQYGYYRTQYEPASLWTSLAAAARRAALVAAACSMPRWWLPPAPCRAAARRCTAWPPRHRRRAPRTPRRRQSAGAGKGMALSGADLAGLIEDSYSLAEAGAAPITPFLDLLT